MEERVLIDLEKAYHTRDLYEFLTLVFPVEWTPIVARIIESGAEYRETDKFAPRWSSIPFTQRVSKRGDVNESYFKSIIFRVHDCLHQLWGLPIPDAAFDEDAYYQFKRMWMCAEVSVLTLTEFVYCQWMYDTQPHLRQYLEHRNTLLFKNTTELKHKSPVQLAARLDQLLHKKIVPKWVRDNVHAREFVADYVPMLQEDRVNIDHNWALLKAQKDKGYLAQLPNQRYSKALDGLELTQWMVTDFYHLLNTDAEVDEALAAFNRERRRHVNLPDTWNAPPPAPE